MTPWPREFGPLGSPALLLPVLCLGLWAQQSLALQCQDGERRIVSKDAEKCCPKCSLEAGGNNPCQDIEDHDCKCPQGHRCGDDNCQYCRKVPECSEGEELARIGETDFVFKCKPCGTGTYSDVKNGWCRNWTDCERFGFVTLRPGNSTHNSRCGFPPSPKDVEQAVLPPSSLSTTILAILTAVAVFVLILLTFLLHFCIWTLKGKYFAADDVDHHSPRPLVAPPLPPQGDETRSIQFPEEEHGDKAAEEKLSMLSLKVSSEIR